MRGRGRSWPGLINPSLQRGVAKHRTRGNRFQFSTVLSSIQACRSKRHKMPPRNTRKETPPILFLTPRPSLIPAHGQRPGRCPWAGMKQAVGLKIAVDESPPTTAAKDARNDEPQERQKSSMIFLVNTERRPFRAHPNRPPSPWGAVGKRAGPLLAWIEIRSVATAQETGCSPDCLDYVKP